jgi:hypothetical protein
MNFSRPASIPRSSKKAVRGTSTGSFSKRAGNSRVTTLPAAAGRQRTIAVATRRTVRPISCSGCRRRSRICHVDAFARAVEWDLKGRELAMTDCWLNIMSRNAVHGLHLHPLSTLSGTYYVHVPAGSPGIKFEDPRLDRHMAAPPPIGARRLQEPAMGHSARRGRTGGSVRELAAP